MAEGPEGGAGPPTTLLDREVRYDHVVAAGALELYSAKHVQRWFGGKDALTVREVLDVPTHPGRLFWAVMRERLVPPDVLRRMAIATAREFLRRMAHRGTYIDFRTGRALDTGQAYVDGAVSLGAMRAAAAKAGAAATDVAELNDRSVAACASIAGQALLPNAEEAQSQVFYTFVEFFDSREDFHWLLDQARSILGSTAA